MLLNCETTESNFLLYNSGTIREEIISLYVLIKQLNLNELFREMFLVIEYCLLSEYV